MVSAHSKHRAAKSGRWIGFMVLWCAVGLLASPAVGHVLKGPHVLELMTAKKTGAQTLQVDQQVVIEDAAVIGRPVELTETLNYVYPNRFRSEIRNQNTHRIHVHAMGQAITIVDDTITVIILI